MRALKATYTLSSLLFLITVGCDAPVEKVSKPTTEELLTGKWQVKMVQPVALDTLNKEMQEIYYSEMEPLLVDSYIIFGEANRFSGDIAGDIRKGEWRVNKESIQIVSANEQAEQWSYEWENNLLIIFSGKENDRYKITLKKEEQ